MKKEILLDFAFPLAAASVLTVIIGLTDADIKIQKLFYTAETGWFYADETLWSFLYNWGNIPAVLLALLGLFIFLLGYFRNNLIRLRKAGLFLVIFIVLGPGLVVNAILKDHWGRPRPADIVQFGGTESFHQAWERGIPGQGKSFPSGHASIGFFLFAPFFIFRKNAAKLAKVFLFMGISYGLLMGLGRMLQGGHFPSDVLWAGVITYITGAILYYAFRFGRGAY